MLRIFRQTEQPSSVPNFVAKPSETCTGEPLLYSVCLVSKMNVGSSHFHGPFTGWWVLDECTSGNFLGMILVAGH